MRSGECIYFTVLFFFLSLLFSGKVKLLQYNHDSCNTTKDRPEIVLCVKLFLKFCLF